MKLAVITITYNDGFKFEEWFSHYKEYKDEIYLHIIVDNNSSADYLELVKNKFVNSKIIERNSNGGCTGAYNEGIKYALQHKEVDAIMLLANDIIFKKGGLTRLYSYLYSNEKLGMVSPITLNKESSIVSDFGASISNSLRMIPYMKGVDIKDVIEKEHYCQAVSGGSCMAKRSFYEIVGLQDEKLFMYSDEVDMGIRSAHKGIALARISFVQAWHHHINNNLVDVRPPYCNFLPVRNKIYLGYKHYGFFRAFQIFLYFISVNIILFFRYFISGRYEMLKGIKYAFLGAFYGLFKNMKPNKYSV